MASESLTAEQLAFLEKCNLDFSNRFTDSDLEYRQIYESEIPPPPIMCPWFGRPKAVPRRGRGHGSRYDGDRDDYRRRRDDYYDRRDSYHNHRSGY